MGIYNFFTWFKQNFNQHITKFVYNKKISYDKNNILFDILPGDIVKFDNFMIDLNGIIHNSAQKVYKYGNYTEKDTNNRLLPRFNNSLYDNKPKIKESNYELEQKLFEDITYTIFSLYNKIKPKKKFIIAIDGPAPLAKQYQQRKRRYKSSNSLNTDFDPNCITPGTRFMDSLSKYIANFLKTSRRDNKISCDIIFSNEKVVGEGEHKILEFIRNNNKLTPYETYCFYGVDSDLIMLALSTHIKDFYIFREDFSFYNKNNYLLIDINNVRKDLLYMLNWSILDWENNNKFIENYAINDFILLCFILGNDFIPNSPSIEIITGGIEFMIDIYKTVCKDYGHLTFIDNNNDVCINIKNIGVFFKKLSEFDLELMTNRFKNKSNYFTDECLENSIVDNSSIDIDKYKNLYYDKIFKFNNYNFTLKKDFIIDMCHSYIQGLQFVLTYYTKGVPCWNWYYKYHYSPFSFEIYENINSMLDSNYKKNIYTNSSYGLLPFQQLLCVLPPRSSNLLPYPLNELLTDKKSPLIKYCPDNIEIDLSGKNLKYEYQGVVLISMIDMEILLKSYNENINKVDLNELKRNKFGKIFFF